MHELLSVAIKEYGVEEAAGEGNNERILQYARDVGFNGYDRDAIPWCSIFMNWVAKKAKYEHTGKGNARSWLNVGQDVGKPEPGDIAVFWREKPASWKGHVGLYLGFSQDGERIYCLGGNQDNRVDITAYGVSRLLGFRRLRPTDADLPATPLKRGDTGLAVRELQSALNLGGFDAGTIDGIFGPKTERATRTLQSTDDDVEITGVYNLDTRSLLESILRC